MCGRFSMIFDENSIIAELLHEKFIIDYFSQPFCRENVSLMTVLNERYIDDYFSWAWCIVHSFSNVYRRAEVFP